MTKEAKISANLKSNGIIVKDIRSFSQIGQHGGRSRLGKIGGGGLSDHISQNFSSIGGRLTSVEKIGTLRLKDKILTSFSVTDAKSNLMQERPRSLLSVFQDGQVKETRFIESAKEGSADKFQVNTRMMKKVVQR